MVAGRLVQITKEIEKKTLCDASYLNSLTF